MQVDMEEKIQVVTQICGDKVQYKMEHGMAQVDGMYHLKKNGPHLQKD